MTAQNSRISSAELAKHFGLHADRARAGEPIRTTKYGREDLVLVSAAEYDRLLRRDRRVYRTGEMPQYLLDAIAKAEPPANWLNSTIWCPRVGQAVNREDSRPLPRHGGELFVSVGGRSRKGP